jgi:hypothetical protein
MFQFFKTIILVISLIYFYSSFSINSPQYREEEAAKEQKREDRQWAEWRIKFIATEYLGKSLTIDQLVTAYMQLEKAKAAGKNLDKFNQKFKESCEVYNHDLKTETSVNFRCETLHKLIHDIRYDAAPEWKQLKTLSDCKALLNKDILVSATIPENTCEQITSQVKYYHF